MGIWMRCCARTRPNCGGCRVWGRALRKQFGRLIWNWSSSSSATGKRPGYAGISSQDPEYPERLASSGDDAPPVLFTRGVWDESLTSQTVAIVGTRRPSAISQQAARRVAEVVAQQGITVVSGLAFGVDALAQDAALDAGGRVIAVLGSGVLRVYPPQHAKLAERIQERGALVCEVPPDAAVSTPGLVARNRLISGLAQRVVLIEIRA